MGAAPHGKRRQLEAARAETGGGQQRCPATAVRSGCTAGFGVGSGPPACAGNVACARASGEAKDRTGSTACAHTGGEAETRTAGARSGVQGRSAPLDRAGTRTKAREEAQSCTEAGCSAQAQQSIQPRRTGALGQKTEALRTEKRQKAHRLDGFPACGLFYIHAGSVPV